MSGTDRGAGPGGEPGEDLRCALRDLLPGYRGPADPFARVGAAIRRRRRRRRTWLAVGTAASAAAVLTTAPGIAGLLDAGGPAGLRPGAPPRPGDSSQAATAEPVRPVGSGEVRGVSWRVGSTALSTVDRRCLYGEGALFRRDVTCFSDWTAERGASWSVRALPGGGGEPVTVVLGVAPETAAQVSVRFADGRTVRTAAVRTETDPAARFFVLVLPGTGTVASVTPLSGAGVSLAEPDTDPDEPTACLTSPPACATPSD